MQLSGNIKMKKVIILTMALIFTINADAQNFMTNTVSKCILLNSEIGTIENVMRAISFYYDVKIFTDTTDGNYKTSQWPKNKEMIFTNETFKLVFESFMQATTNLTWRYDNITKNVYIFPLTNSFTMMRCGSISITNETIGKLFWEDKIFGVNSNKVTLVGGTWFEDWFYEKVSLEYQNAFVWEVLDAINSQIPGGKTWNIWDSDFDDKHNFSLRFYGKSDEILREFERTNGWNNTYK